MKLFLFFISSFLYLGIFAQYTQIENQTTMGGSLIDGLYEIKPTSDGGYIVTGASSSNDGDIEGNNGMIDGWLIKLNNNLEPEWKRTVGGTSFDLFYSVDVSSDGGYIGGGFSYSNDGGISGNHGLSDGLIMKFDQQGNIEWQKCIGDENANEFYQIKSTSDNGIVAVGKNNTDGWIVKLNSSQEIEWEKNFNNSMGFQQFFSVIQTDDGGYIAVGYLNEGTSSGLIVRIDTYGNTLWENTYGEGSLDLIYGVHQISDGFIVVGTSNAVDENKQGWIMKINENGELQWENTLGTSRDDQFNAVTELPNGDYLATGMTNFLVGDPNTGDAWIVRINANGELLWQDALGGSKTDGFANSLLRISASSFLVAGSSQSSDGDVTTGNQGDSDGWVVKFNLEELSMQEQDQSVVCLYPNPTTGIINLQTKEKINSVSVYNAVGQKVSFNSLNNENTSIDISNLPGGVYFVEIIINDKTTKRYKVIKK